MSNLTSPTKAPVADEFELAKRRAQRNARLILAGIALAIVALCYAYAATYEPVITELGAPAVQWPNYDSVPGYAKALAVTSKNPVGGVGYFSPAPGFTFGVAQSVTVQGPFPVTVVNVVSAFWTGYHHEVRYRVADQRPVVVRSDRGVEQVVAAPLGSVKLRGNVQESPMLGVEFTVPPCATAGRNYGPDTVIWTIGMRMTYKFLWFTHTVTVPTQAPAVIVNPRDCGTPIPSVNKS